jgi:hypothetical protein
LGCPPALKIAYSKKEISQADICFCGSEFGEQELGMASPLEVYPLDPWVVLCLLN